MLSSIVGNRLHAVFRNFRRCRGFSTNESQSETAHLAHAYDGGSDSATDERYGFTRRRSDYWDQKDIESLPRHLRPQFDETLDLILRQKVYLLQARKGYRVNTDAHVLAYFASMSYRKSHAAYSKPLRVLDLGSGVGLVSILFAKAHHPCTLTLVEKQKQLVHRARRNLELNDTKGNVIHHDLSNGELPSDLHCMFDVILINPPFYTLNGKRKPPSSREKFLSHAETTASFSHFLSAALSASDFRNQNAFVAVIHDIRELPRIREAIRRSPFHINEYQNMHHIPGAAPTRVLMELKLSGQPSWKSETDRTVQKLGDVAREKLILHPYGRNCKAYSQDFERFIQELPGSKLRIGRIKED